MHNFSKFQRQFVVTPPENRSVDGVIIVVQTFCGLKEIALTFMEL